MTLNLILKKILTIKNISDKQAILQLQQQYHYSDRELNDYIERSKQLVATIRTKKTGNLMELIMAEYGLDNREGIALMNLAESLLRIPDSATISQLIADKIVNANWSAHKSHSSSLLVNASTLGLIVTKNLLQLDKTNDTALSVLKNKLSSPIIKQALLFIVKELGNRFIFANTIDKALAKANISNDIYSFDMLGESAINNSDARQYYSEYYTAISAICANKQTDDVKQNHSISIKLSALHPRYEYMQATDCIKQLIAKVSTLAEKAMQGNIGLTIDAEEHSRLALSRKIIEGVISQKRFQKWHGFGVVIQAYNKSCLEDITWVQQLAQRYDCKLKLRLVKGAYWDSEIKHCQEQGLINYNVFVNKKATDGAYLCCIKKLLSGDCQLIYPEFASHNALTLIAVAQQAKKYNAACEIQRLYGMGEPIHKIVTKDYGLQSRCYAPVGIHKDLLAYLIRRLLENSANSSFVNQILDHNLEPKQIISNPFAAIEKFGEQPKLIPLPKDIYQPKRNNSIGFDLDDANTVTNIYAKFKQHSADIFKVNELTTDTYRHYEHSLQLFSPIDASLVSKIAESTATSAELALRTAKIWSANQQQRKQVLNAAADLLEANNTQILYLLSVEAGKILKDGISELREAVDFLRYYASNIEQLQLEQRRPKGIIACISPWNFPLAIFIGQIAAALAGQNAVIAKPAETTPTIAFFAVQLLHEAGVPRSCLQLLLCAGKSFSEWLLKSSNVNGVCFTGSNATAKTIHKCIAKNLHGITPLIAETGGINAMLIDSTALLQQAVTDVVTSAFQSAGQRCSALRVLYVQADIAQQFSEMLIDTIKTLNIGDPRAVNTDIGPLIAKTSKDKITQYVNKAKAEAKLLFQLPMTNTANYYPPTIIAVTGIAEVATEVFGPVLHFATFKAEQLDNIIDDINAKNYGLTFGIHSRINSKVEAQIAKLKVGNIYINRNQIGAVVGSQPFGGENLSGTGPKAGGPNYMRAMTSKQLYRDTQLPRKQQPLAALAQIQNICNKLAAPTAQVLTSTEMPGYTGETNKLITVPRGKILCLGPTLAIALEQAQLAKQYGNTPIVVVPFADTRVALNAFVPRKLLAQIKAIDAVALSSDAEDLKAARIALANRDGKIIPLIFELEPCHKWYLERHICQDITATGGNFELMGNG